MSRKKTQAELLMDIKNLTEMWEERRQQVETVNEKLRESQEEVHRLERLVDEWRDRTWQREHEIRDRAMAVVEYALASGHPTTEQDRERLAHLQARIAGAATTEKVGRPLRNDESF